MIKTFQPIKKYNKTRGFTLVETLVAISIFTLGILGLLVVLSQGISNTSYAKRKIVAAYLAQEGIEYIRNIRDTYMLYTLPTSQDGWEFFQAKVDHCEGTPGFNPACYFDDQDLDYGEQTQPITDIQLYPCDIYSTCLELKYDEATGKYGYGAGVVAGYERVIHIAHISDDEIKVFSTVYWIQGSGNYHMTFTENLFNWIE